MRHAGVRVRVRVLSARAFRSAVRAKAVEEATELTQAADAEVLDELADLYEVIEATRVAYGLSRAALTAAVQRKRRSLGGFGRRLWLG